MTVVDATDPHGAFSVRSPYDGSVVGHVSQVDGDWARDAVGQAATAMGVGLAAHERAAILERIAALLEQNGEELARTIVAEAGKPIRAARAEVARAVQTHLAAATVARTLTGQSIPMDAGPAGAGRLGVTMRVPIGVVAGISSFNFPLNLVAHKTAPALAAGCAIVLKPAPATPLSALKLAELAAEAGLPDGWLHIVPGPAEQIGKAFVEDPRVRLITFTGSDRVGWSLREQAPRKRVCLELGNCTPVIVCDDADIDDAIPKMVAGAFGFAGQSCVSVQRVIVSDAILDEVRDALVGAVQALKVGDPAEETTDVGPMIARGETDRLLAWIEEAVDDGARVLTGGTADENLMSPTVVEGVMSHHALAHREAFGPICVLERFSKLRDAIARANATEYGLQAGIFTGSLTSAMRAARGLQFGGVTINDAPTLRVDHAPYGGVKSSGTTREGPAWAALEMTEERLVVINTGESS